LDFIRGLQPFFKSGEIEFADAISGEARAQLLGFPTGRMDVPNALAYMLTLAGIPIYDSFGQQHVAGELPVLRSSPCWLAVDATAQYTCACLLQLVRGGLHVVADWVREGPPGDVLPEIVRAAGLEAGRAIRLVCPVGHFSDHDLIGLRPAAARIPVRLQAGGDPVAGRDELRRLLLQTRRDVPLVRVSSLARWTLNALAGGYRRRIEKGQPGNEPVEGIYRTLMTGLEAFVAASLSLGEEAAPRYALAADGRRYATIDPRLAEQPVPSKDQWAG
jgi:hypothetical protein